MAAYRWHSQKHGDQLFLVQDRMSDKSVGESGEAPATLFDECGISRKVVTIDYKILVLYCHTAREKHTSNSLGW